MIIAIMNTSLYDLISKYKKSLMGVAALWIFIYHFPSRFRFDAVPLLFEIEYFIKKAGDCGVNIFFFLSGIGVPNSYDSSKNVIVFYKKRISRIFLPGVVSHLLTSYFYDWSFIEFIKNASGYTFLFESVNSYFWFYYAIIIIYLLFPLYYKYFVSSNNKTSFSIAAILFLFVIMVVGRKVINEDTYIFLTRIPAFIIGVLVNHFGKKGNKADAKRWTTILYLFMFIIGVLTFFLTETQYILFPNFYMFFSYTIIAVSICALTSHVFKTKKTYLFSFYGDISLEFYSFQKLLGEFPYTKPAHTHPYPHS